jgi:hypothetical protein
MSGVRRAVAAVAVGGSAQVDAARVGGFDVDEQHGAPRLVGGGLCQGGTGR